MRKVKLSGLICLWFFIGGCAHYQSSFDHYKGPGGGVSSYRSASQSREFHLVWPVEQVKISQAYRPPRNKKHQGIDLRGAKGTSIYAAHPGRVIYTGNSFRGYGKMVMIEYGSKWASLYAHLDKIDIKEGAYVQAGDRIGRMGRTGRATGVHLHFELMREKLPVDPLHHLPQTDASRMAGN